MESFDLDQSLRDSVTGLVSALGGIDFANPNRPYVLGDDALGCLKDLKKWVKFYGASGKLDALRCIADTNLVSLDLCQILGSFREGQENDKVKWRMALNCLELLVQLTWQIEVDPSRAEDSVQISYEAPLKAAQIGYKNAILHHTEHNVLRPIIRIALPSMAIPRRDRPERDDHIISLAICLLRNLVEISARSAQAAGMDRDKNESSRSETIMSFEKSDVFNLLAALAAGTTDEFEKIDCLLLEVLYHLLKGVNPEDVFISAVESRSKPLVDLSNMLQKEETAKRQHKRFGPTRHNRFGTMISVVKDNDLRLTVPGQTSLLHGQAHTLEKLDSAKKFHKPNRAAEANELDKPVHLTSQAAAVLNTFITSFLETSFNPLFTSVVRAIERESSRCLDAHRTQVLFVIGWFLKAHLHQHSKGTRREEHLDYGNVAAVFDPRCLVLVLRIMRDASDHKNWTELHAAMECFEELLKSVQAMSTGNSEDDNEIANNILLNLFYDETHLDLIISNVRNYKRQSFGFLDTCTSLASTVLKLLEQFSQDRRLYVKSKRQRTKNHTTHEDDGDSEAEDERAVTKRVAEKVFQFTSFESKFVNDPCIDTFRSLLDFYVELRPEQIKRVLVFFHRIFVKRKQQVILYRLDICELLSRMVNDEVNIPRDSSTRKHLEDFFKHYTYSLTKALKKTPALFVELIFSKMSPTLYYLQHGEEEVAPAPKRPRAAAEFEVRPGRNKDDQLAVVVAALLDDQKSEPLDSLKTVFADVISELRAWEDEAKARRILNGEEQNNTEEPRKHVTNLKLGDANLTTAIFKDGKLQLLLKLMGAERFDDFDAFWVIPENVAADDLETNLRLLKQYIDEPPSFEDGKTGADLIRRKVVQKESYSDSDASSPSDSSDSGSTDKPRKPSKKRKRKAVDDADIEARRKKRRLADLEKRAMIKSAVRIEESDDDEEAEREFFGREKELRERMARRADEGNLPEKGTRKVGAKKKRAGKRAKRTMDLGSDARGSETEMEGSVNGGEVFGMASLEPSSQVSISLDDNTDQSDTGDMRPSKKRKFRRALSVSSDEE